MQTARELYREQRRHRLIKGAVEEAQRFPKDLCNQHCKTHIYIKDGLIYDQATGRRHDCIMTRIAKMFIGHYKMVSIERVTGVDVSNLQAVLDNAWVWCDKWSKAFDKWKQTGIVPLSEEVEAY